jgi:hypothetical protein
MGGECTTYRHEFSNATVIVTCCNAHTTAMNRALHNVYLAKDRETAAALALAAIPWLEQDIDPKRVVYDPSMDPY